VTGGSDCHLLRQFESGNKAWNVLRREAEVLAEVPVSAIGAPGPLWVRLFSLGALPQREAQCSKCQVIVFLCAREEGLDGSGGVWLPLTTTPLCAADETSCKHVKSLDLAYSVVVAAVCRRALVHRQNCARKRRQTTEFSETFQGGQGAARTILTQSSERQHQ
jgi:hypothetical protein